MSPTSYQAAPPREFIIADAQGAVKRIGPTLKSFSAAAARCSILIVGFAIGRDSIRRRMHVAHASGHLAGTKHIGTALRDPILLMGDRISGGFADIAGRVKVVERGRSSFLVLRVVLDGLPHHRQISAQRSLMGATNRLFVASRAHSREDYYDRDHDHQFEQSETTRRAPSRLRCNV